MRWAFAAPDLVQRAVRVRCDRWRTVLISDDACAGMARHDFFAAGMLASRPLLELLERSGVKVSRATQHISAGLAAPAVGDGARVNIGSPLIELTRVVYDGKGRAVEHLHALYRPDRYSLTIEPRTVRQAKKKTWAPVAMRARPRKSKSATIQFRHFIGRVVNAAST